MTDLEQLALRCEQASGPDYVLDYAIWQAVVEPRDPNARQPEYSASIDAALTLVPRTGFVELNFFFGNNQHKLDENSGKENALVWPVYNEERCEEGNAATPALALCAASLRARSA